MHLRLTAGVASTVAAVALALTAGCGSADNDDACDKILEVGNSVATESANVGTDFTALGELYTTKADEIRNAASGASGDVGTAASNLADAMQALGTSMASFDPTSPEVPDTAAFAAAGEAMDSACNS